MTELPFSKPSTSGEKGRVGDNVSKQCIPVQYQLRLYMLFSIGGQASRAGR